MAKLDQIRVWEKQIKICNELALSGFLSRNDLIQLQDKYKKRLEEQGK